MKHLANNQDYIRIIKQSVKSGHRVFAGNTNYEVINDSDGLRIDFDEGWLHVRASNTEPIARIIAEASDSLTAFKLANRVKL